MGAALYQTSATQDLKLSNNNLLDCYDIAAQATKEGRQCTTKGFTTFDFSAGVKKDNWTLDIYLQNAFDTRGVLTTNTFCSIDFCAGSSRNFTGRPQIFGFKFGKLKPPWFAPWGYFLRRRQGGEPGGWGATAHVPRETCDKTAGLCDRKADAVKIASLRHAGDRAGIAAGEYLSVAPLPIFARDVPIQSYAQHTGQ
ncbi:hypothetical protein E4T56_gene19851 [Termitomyces sp. T112]|nr:hypothetical protein E4T56_gene19851 [Termitomyces sp. T112]